MLKLGGIRDGTVYCTDGLTVGTWTAETGFEPRSTFPNPNDGIDRFQYAVLNRRASKRLLGPITGVYTTANVWPLAEEHLLATVGRWVFSSADGGYTWSPVWELPASSGPMGVHPTAVCESGGKVYLAEYPLGDEDARILVSDDRGRSWSTYVERSDVRHFHGVYRDHYSGRLWGTTGDSDDQSAIGYFKNDRFVPIGRGSQRWRAVSLVFTPDYVLWGMDCSFADSIPIYRLPRERLEGDNPSPDVMVTTDTSVYYSKSLDIGGDVWVVMVTASEAGIDSHAPSDKQRNTSGRAARVLASCSNSGFNRWYELFSFDRRHTLSELDGRIPTSNGYVFLEADPDVGFVLNPYNVKHRSGEIITIGGDDLDPRSLPEYRESPRTEATIGTPP